MSRNHYKLMEIINEWIFHTKKLKEIVSFLYSNTELFEEKYEKDFDQDLFDFFSGKITRYSKEINQLDEVLEERKRKILTEIQVKERGF